MVRLVILRVLESYFRHRWLYLLPIILMWVIAGFSISRDPEYLAHGIMYVEQESVLTGLISDRDTNRSWETPADRTRDEISDLLQTDAFIYKIIQETDLGTDSDELTDEEYAAIIQTMSDARDVIWADAPGRNQVRVAATHTNPKIAYQLVKATIDNYTLWKVEANHAGNVTADEFYNDRLEQYDTNLDIARHELENYFMAHPASTAADDDRPVTETLEINRLQSELTSANALYANTLRLKDEAALSLSQADESIRQTYFFIDAPRVPAEPATSLKSIAVQIIIFTVVGIILSVVAVIGSMLLDRSFRFPIDVQYGVNLPVIATVPDAE